MTLPSSWLVPGTARAHGGDEHDVPTTGLVPPGGGDSWVTGSTEFEAVLRVPDTAVGQAATGHLYVSDFATSAPVSPADLTLRLAGADDVALEPQPAGTPGVWSFPVSLPVAGAYTAQLQVIAGDRSDALGFPTHDLGPEVREAENASIGWGLVVGVGVLGVILGAAIAVLVNRRRRPPTALVGAVLAAVVLGSATGVTAHEGDDHAAPAPAAVTVAGTLRLPIESQFLLGLRTVPARSGLIEERVEALGVTEAPPGDRAEVTAPVTGWFDFGDVPLVPGAMVQKGQVFGRLVELLPGADRATAAATRAQAFVELADAQRAVALAERDVSKIDQLGDVLSAREALDRQHTLDVARERAEQASALIAKVGQEMPTTLLRAPLSGHISAIYGRPGDLVRQGDLLLRLIAHEALWVRVNVPTALAGEIFAAADADVVADARPDLHMSGTVLDAGREADPLTGTTQVTIALPDPIDGIIPGSTVRAGIEVGRERRGLLVPDAAVVDAAGQTLVFVKVGPEAFVERPVRIGVRSGEDREVVEGLTPGERVVVQSTYALRSLAGR